MNLRKSGMQSFYSSVCRLVRRSLVTTRQILGVLYYSPPLLSLVARSRGHRWSEIVSG